MISFSYTLPTLFSHPSAAFSAEAFSHCFCHSLENRTVTKEWQQEPRLDFSYGSYQYQLPHDELSSQLAQCKKLPHVVLCSGTLSYLKSFVCLFVFSLVFFSVFFFSSSGYSEACFKHVWCLKRVCAYGHVSISHKDASSFELTRSSQKTSQSTKKN